MQSVDIAIVLVTALIFFGIVLGPKRKWSEFGADLGQAFREVREIIRRR